MKDFPKREHFFKPVLQAITDLGGSGTNEEINDRVIELLKIPQKILDIRHKNSAQTKFEYEMAWVRTMLKTHGLIENSKRGVWAIIKKLDQNLSFNISLAEEQRIDEEIDKDDWKEQLMEVIIKNLSPTSFEKLIQRILREKGFTQVEVTGRSGDGGIDGKGIAKINGILSFYIIFQCKRYTGKVSAKEIRDFRGSMVGRTDKGLFITTGSFTRPAIEEATRDGAPTIDLIDGDKLADKLKELRLGVDVELKEKITINESWFKNFDNL